jgi:hypothetical protein
MSEITVALVQDPLLRQSLRALYPELPAWAQRTLIATPDTPLPMPPGYDHPAWASVADAKHALEMICERLHTTTGQLWTVTPNAYSNVHEYRIRSPHRAMRPQVPPEGAAQLVRCTVREKKVIHLAFEDSLGTLILSERHNPTIDWAFTVRGGVNVQCLTDTLNRAVTRIISGQHEAIFADGTTEFLLAPDGKPAPIQRDNLVDYGTPDVLAERLAERWQTLTAPEDRARVLHFWLGNSHPVLAQAGLHALAHHQSISSASHGPTRDPR